MAPLASVRLDMPLGRPAFALRRHDKKPVAHFPVRRAPADVDILQLVTQLESNPRV